MRIKYFERINIKSHPSEYFNDLWVRLVGIPLISFFVPLIFFNYSLISKTQPYWLIWLLSFANTWLYWEGNRYLFIQNRLRYQLISQTRKRIFYLTLTSVAYTTLVCLILDRVVADYLPERYVYEPALSKKLTACIFVDITVIAIYECIIYFRQLQDALLDAEHLKQENLRSQLETLKNQVNPHFLFNCLNTLVSVMALDIDLATDYVQKLARVYRYILEIATSETVTVQEELTALRAYAFLMQTRFARNLSISINIDSQLLDLLIIPLSLQILLENAIKHNVVSTQCPLTVEIFSSGSQITVCNKLQRKNSNTDSTGIGLQNIQARYQLMTNESIHVSITETTFSVSVPLIIQSIHASANH